MDTEIVSHNNFSFSTNCWVY